MRINAAQIRTRSTRRAAKAIAIHMDSTRSLTAAMGLFALSGLLLLALLRLIGP